jgi:hypothetical protein
MTMLPYDSCHRISEYNTADVQMYDGNNNEYNTTGMLWVGTAVFVTY